MTPALGYRENVIWVDWLRDVRAFLMYRRERRLGFREWLASLRGEKMWAVYSREDWGPGVALTLNLPRVATTRFGRRGSPSAAK